MRTTQSFSFYCRTSKATKQGLAPVELSIIINQKRVFINLPLKYSPEEFNKKRQPAYIAQAIDEYRTKINWYIVEMMHKNIPLTADNLREVLKSGGVKSYTIQNLFDDYLNILNKRVGVNLSKGVYRKYELVRDLFFEYVNPSHECTDITPAIIQRFYGDLGNKYDTSTAAGYMTKLKTFVTFGIDNAHITINPFQNIKIVKGKKDITYLSESEINYLSEQRLENQSLQRVLDLFIVMCGTGLSFADLAQLEGSDIAYNGNVAYISKRRVKTGVQYTSVILPFALKVIQKYDGNLPRISNQKLNTYLHTIETLLGFHKSLHAHLARHSYATLLINRSVNIQTIAKAMGHTNSKITSSFYAKLLDTTVIDEISKII